MLSSAGQAELDAFTKAVVDEENKSLSVTMSNDIPNFITSYTAGMHSVGKKEGQQKDKENGIVLKSVYYSAKESGSNLSKFSRGAERPQSTTQTTGELTITQGTNAFHPSDINNVSTGHSDSLAGSRGPFFQRLLSVLSVRDCSANWKLQEPDFKQARISYTRSPAWPSAGFTNQLENPIVEERVGCFGAEKMDQLLCDSTYVPQNSPSKLNRNHESHQRFPMSRRRFSYEFIHPSTHYLLPSLTTSEESAVCSKSMEQYAPKLPESHSRSTFASNSSHPYKLQQECGNCKKKRESFDDEPIGFNPLITLEKHTPSKKGEERVYSRRNGNGANKDGQSAQVSPDCRNVVFDSRSISVFPRPAPSKVHKNYPIREKAERKKQNQNPSGRPRRCQLGNAFSSGCFSELAAPVEGNGFYISKTVSNQQSRLSDSNISTLDSDLDTQNENQNLKEKQFEDNNCGTAISLLPRDVTESTSEFAKRLNNKNSYVSPISKAKNYKCYLIGCSKEFPKLGQLFLHLRHHSNQEPTRCYLCPWKGCGKKFKRRDERKRHYRCHTGEKPYKCEHCGRRFARLDHQKSHLKNIHHVMSVDYKMGRADSSSPGR